MLAPCRASWPDDRVDKPVRRLWQANALPSTGWCSTSCSSRDARLSGEGNPRQHGISAPDNIAPRYLTHCLALQISPGALDKTLVRNRRITAI
jgi:hypothetical protein